MTHIHRVSRSHRRRILIPSDYRWFDDDGAIAGCWGAWQPKGALTQEHSYTDVSGHLHSAVPAVAPDWDQVNGWKFNGSTHYLYTAFIPTSDQAQSVFVQFSTLSNRAANPGLLGIDEAINADFKIRCEAGLTSFRNGSTLAIAGATQTSGNYAIAGNKGYINGAAQAGTIGAWSQAPTTPFLIGAENRPPARAFAAVYIQAVALYHAALSAADVATIAAAMAAL